MKRILCLLLVTVLMFGLVVPSSATASEPKGTITTTIADDMDLDEKISIGDYIRLEFFFDNIAAAKYKLASLNFTFDEGCFGFDRGSWSIVPKTDNTNNRLPDPVVISKFNAELLDDVTYYMGSYLIVDDKNIVDEKKNPDYYFDPNGTILALEFEVLKVVDNASFSAVLKFTDKDENVVEVTTFTTVTVEGNKFPDYTLGVADGAVIDYTEAGVTVKPTLPEGASFPAGTTYTYSTKSSEISFEDLDNKTAMSFTGDAAGVVYKGVSYYEVTVKVSNKDAGYNDSEKTVRFQIKEIDLGGITLTIDGNAIEAAYNWRAEGYTVVAKANNNADYVVVPTITYSATKDGEYETATEIKNVGFYKVIAKIDADGYKYYDLTTTPFEIKANAVDEITLTLDNAPITEEGIVLEWDGNEHALAFVNPTAGPAYTEAEVAYEIKYKANAGDADWSILDDGKIKDIGIYEVTATFTKEGYAQKKVTRTIEITEATFKNATLRLDGSNVDENQKIPYDGKSHTVVLANVDAEYVTYHWVDNNGVSTTNSTSAPVFTNAGPYTIRAIAERTNYKTEEFYIVVRIEPLTATISDVTFEEKQYDGKTTATLKDYKLSGILDSEKDSVTVKEKPVFAFDNANAGENKTVIATGDFVLSSGNYILVQPAASSLKGTITPIEVTVTPEKTANNKLVTDESDVEFDYTLGFADTVTDTLKITKEAFEGALGYDLGDDAAPVLNKEYPITVGTLELKDDYAQNYKVNFNQNGAYFKVIDKVYTGLEVETMPTTTTYIEGQPFNPAGLVLEATYQDADGVTDLTEFVYDGYDWTPEILEADTTNVVISFAGKTTNVPVTVEAKKLNRIFYEIDNSETSFKIGKTLTRNSLKVYAEYNNGVDTKVLLKEGTDYTVDTSAVKMDTVGTYKVVITHKNDNTKTTDYTVKVVDKVVTKIEVTAGEGAVVNYIDNGKQTFKANGFVVKAFYDTDAADAEGTVVTDYTYTPDSTKILTVADKKVTFSYTYGGKTVTKDYPITVEENNATGIVVTKNADTCKYTEGNYFDPTGTVVKVTYRDGTYKLITGTVTKYCEANGVVYKEVDETYAEAGITFAPEKVQLNTTQITVSLGTLTALKGIAITVNAKKVNDLEITEYAETAVDGDSAASVIKKVTAKYDNGDVNTNFTAYTVSPATLTLTDKTAEQNIVVTVEYKNPGEELSYSDTVTVKVIPCEATNDNTGKNYASFTEAVAEANDGDVIVLKNDVEITEDITVEKNITIKTGDNKLTTAEGASLNTAKKVVVTFDTTGASADTVITVNGAEMTIAKDTTSEVAAKSDFSVGKQIMNAYSYIETFYRDITVVKSANGTISGRTKNKVGEDVKFTITPKAGYVVEDVIVDNVSVGAVTEYEFVNIRGDHTITAIFAEIAE